MMRFSQVALYLLPILLQTASADEGVKDRFSMTDTTGLCPKEKADLGKSHEEFEKAGIKYTGVDGNACSAVVKHTTDCCNDPRMDCGVRPVTFDTSKGKGLNESYDKMADGAMKTSNMAKSNRQSCDRLIARGHNELPSVNSCIQSIKDKKHRHVGEKYFKAQQSLSACLKKQDKHFEDMARDILSKKGLSDAMDCSSGVCLYKDAGEKLNKFSPEDPDLKATPARISDGGLDSLNCSGTVVGQKTVITAAHCGLASKDVKFEVPDETGVMRTVTGGCSGPAYEDLARDFAVCTLDSPVKAKPAYLATVDPTISGTSCVPVGHVLRCPTAAFDAANGGRVSAATYPKNYYDTGIVSTGQMQTITGPEMSRVFYNNYTDVGSSGGGIISNIDGYNAIVAPVSVGPSYDPTLGVSPIIYYQDVKGFQIQSLSARQLQSMSPSILSLGQNR